MHYVYIYSLNCPITYLPRYVGKSLNPEERYKQHMRRANYISGRTHKQCWIKYVITQLKLKPTLTLLEKVPDDQWQEREKWWIDFFKCCGFDLVNISTGGQGYIGQHPLKDKRLAPVSEEVKKKISETLKGHKVSVETRQKIREKSIGRPSPNKGKVLSIEEREKISKGLKGNIPWNKGKKMSEEYCRVNSESHKGKKLSEDHKRKIGDAHRGMKYKKNKKSKSGEYKLCP